MNTPSVRRFWDRQGENDVAYPGSFNANHKELFNLRDFAGMHVQYSSGLMPYRALDRGEVQVITCIPRT